MRYSNFGGVGQPIGQQRRHLANHRSANRRTTDLRSLIPVAGPGSLSESLIDDTHLLQAMPGVHSDSTRAYIGGRCHQNRLHLEQAQKAGTQRSRAGRASRSDPANPLRGSTCATTAPRIAVSASQGMGHVRRHRRQYMGYRRLSTADPHQLTASPQTGDSPQRPQYRRADIHVFVASASCQTVLTYNTKTVFE